ncbi:bifunctional alpha,alpha-trehalose-phosphate synthase (UDP-forming)/trehalose-phosphatase [uncultured Bacteroides sp.]|uniref:bifunctional alpha,alpha-trehalose-phosphate synthase (UDP-forming)/trehalose-phosphatase n=1 Tax=uncultured Bacteroides sp. TaxID=162156 RepID=UPI002AAB7EC8|nr:bifunctional alpha,alpha-trehalose-phosphate synthase (UDP-forming)/trehalose-phosphatase [uncultured Bacteroides sp.]
MKLIIISNRLPIKVIKKNGKMSFTPSEGGLATGLASLQTTMEKHWIGWPGIYTNDDNEKEIITQHLNRFNYHPVFLSKEQIEEYYHQYSNSVVWPLCHYFYAHVDYELSSWETYREVNRLFAQISSLHIEEGDIVWVQDYQLMLLPMMLRKENENISIGYFHHIPFPSYELFRILPERAEILDGLLGADLIGFHTPDYMRHFMSAVERVLNMKFVMDETKYNNRVIHVDSFPMGINYKKYSTAPLKTAPQKISVEWKKRFGSRKIIISVDRLDYSKGILHRLKAFNRFLEEYPEYHEKVSLVMIVVPSRDKVNAYADLKMKINETIGMINGRYSNLSWTPVHYFYHSFSFEKLIALYQVSDIALVSPLRDGMNLVAKEYVAAKRNTPGVLILSEMAGAAQELRDAIIVNPNDIDELKRSMVKALEMPVEEQEKRMAKMQKVISSQTIQKWARDFANELSEIKQENKLLTAKLLNDEKREPLVSDYQKANKRLIVLDYDGTLSPFTSIPEDAIPSPELIALLNQLIDDPKNTVAISSGRDQQTLTEWFGDLSIILAAEHGAFVRHKNGDWVKNIAEEKWDKEIVDTLIKITDKTPGAFLETKRTALVWHYRNVDPWAAALREQQLVSILRDKCDREGLQIMKGNKIIEVKTMGCDKGAVINNLLKAENYDYMFAIGDDTTDEDMFRAMPQSAYTIKVGEVSDSARFYLKSQKAVLPLLKKMIEKD